LALLVDREHDGMIGWIDIKSDHVLQLVDKVGIVSRV
jgi:hypothetical protein